MKAVVIKVLEKSAYVLLENGKFAIIPKTTDMKAGSEIYIAKGFIKRLTRVVNIAACFTAVAFAMIYLAYCLNILMFH